MEPLLYNIKAFDKNKEQKIVFAYSGNQIKKNRLIIKNNLNNNTVYDKIQDNMQLFHTLPANSIKENGISYYARLQVLENNSTDTWSSFSKPVLFNCFSTPIFNFSNLIESQVIKNSSFKFQLNYQQNEKEPLNKYKVDLYDDKKTTLLFSTGIKYTNNSDLSASITDLLDNSEYNLRAYGETLNGMELDTGFVNFSVEYKFPTSASVMQCENIYDKGYIKLSSYIVSIKGKSNPEPPKYVNYLNKDWVDLTDKNSWVIFDKDFQINNDFTIQMIAKDLNYYNNFFELSNGNSNIELIMMKQKFRSTDKEKAYIELRVHNKNMHKANDYIKPPNYILISNFLDINSNKEKYDKKLNIWLKRINNLYEIKIS